MNLSHISIFLTGILTTLSLSAFAQIGGNIPQTSASPITSSPLEIQRIRSQGPATIDCVQLFDSRCANRLSAAAPMLPVCTPSISSANVSFDVGGSAIVMLNSACSPAANEVVWTNLMAPYSGFPSVSVVFNMAGYYCFAIKGRNTIKSSSWGPTSSNVCVNVTENAPPSPTACTIVCPGGTLYDIGSGECRAPATVTCATGTTIAAGYQYFLPNTGQFGGICSNTGPLNTPPTCGMCPAGQVWNAFKAICEPKAPVQGQNTDITVVLDQYGTNFVSLGGTQPVCSHWGQSTVSCTWNVADSTLSCPIGTQSNAVSISTAAQALWPGPAPATGGIGTQCQKLVYSSWY